MDTNTQGKDNVGDGKELSGALPLLVRPESDGAQRRDHALQTHVSHSAFGHIMYFALNGGC